MRGMAIIASGYRLVAVMTPAIELLTHDVTIKAVGRIVR